MTRTKTTVLVGVAALVLVAAGVAVKLIFFPSVKDEYFQISQQRLRRVPKEFVVVRPTHFPDSAAKSSPPGMTQVNVNGVSWMVGRNVSLQQLIATAYSYNPGRIALPPNAPPTHFDYLVTVPASPQGRLQTAIKKKLGYTADRETRDTDVLALKVEDPNSPGLKVSSSDEKTGQNMKGGRLYLTHQKMSDIVNPVTDVLQTPVVDKTGLTGFYDFSLVWNNKIAQGNLSRDDIENILKEWGLGLEPDTASLEMLVVKKTY